MCNNKFAIDKGAADRQQMWGGVEDDRPPDVNPWGIWGGQGQQAPSGKQAWTHPHLTIIVGFGWGTLGSQGGQVMNR